MVIKRTLGAYSRMATDPTPAAFKTLARMKTSDLLKGRKEVERSGK